MKKLNKENLKELGHLEAQGIDDDGNEVLTNVKEGKWITPTKLLLPSGKVVSIDPKEGCFEAYNPNKFKIVWQNIHYNPMERAIRSIITQPPLSHQLIPHSYYTPWIEAIGNSPGEAINLIINHGSEMFKGNTKPSAPDFRKKLY